MTAKILALDLDGIAVDDNGALSARTKRSFRAAQSHGYKLCFVTGRRGVDMVSMGEDAKLADYLILNNGGKLIETARGEVLENICVDKADVRRLVAFCLINDYMLHVINGHYWGVNKMNPRIEAYASELGVSPVTYNSLEDIPKLKVEGFMTVENGHEILTFIEREGLGLYGVESEAGCFDIMPAGVYKWEGILRLAQLLGTPSADIIAVGNDWNDLDMIEHAGIGVAVANSLDGVKKKADYVTEADNNHDAIAEIVERFILHGTLEEHGL